MHHFEMKQIKTYLERGHNPPPVPRSLPRGEGTPPTIRPLGIFGASILALCALAPHCFFDKPNIVYRNILLPITLQHDSAACDVIMQRMDRFQVSAGAELTALHAMAVCRPPRCSGLASPADCIEVVSG